jgi:GPI mannosyltransferase 1 subunit M
MGHPLTSFLRFLFLENTLSVVAIGLFIRCFVAYYAPIYFGEVVQLEGDSGSSFGHSTSRVAYTDIDYHVYADAASHIKNGGSPYDRSTYRYTPYLAAFIANCVPAPHAVFARYVFCFADTLVGFLIRRLRQKQRQWQSESLISLLLDTWGWMYNPLAINICTRGSAESIQVLLPVLCTVTLLMQIQENERQGLRQEIAPLLALMAGTCHGVAIHAKIYPVIYSVTYMTYLSSSNSPRINESILTWCYSMVYRYAAHPLIWIFCAASIATFVIVTMSGAYYFGPQALSEGLWYHVGRVDHRHNYSLHYYWIYLHRAVVASSLPEAESVDHDPMPEMSPTLFTIGVVLLIPQAILLLYTSISRMARHSLCFTMFLQTFIFVAYNKVLTAQYFTWYVCLLPLCVDFSPGPNGFFYFVSGGRCEGREYSSALPAQATRVVTIGRSLANSSGSENQSTLSSPTRTASSSMLLRATVALIVGIASWLGTAYFLELRGYAVYSQNWLSSLLFFFAHTNMLRVIVRLATSEIGTRRTKASA